MKKKHVALLIIIIILFFLAHIGNSPSPGSSYAQNQYGIKAFFLLLQKMNQPIDRWVKPYSELAQLNQNKNVMFVVEPIELADVNSLQKWVRQGNWLVYFHAQRNTAINHFIKARPCEEDECGETFNFSEMLPSTDQEVLVTCRDPVCDQVFSVSEARNKIKLIKDRNIEILAGTKDAAQSYHFKEGQGEVWVFADSTIISNQKINRFDNLRLLYQLASLGQTILFDEFHHGYREPIPEQTLGRFQALIALIVGITLWLIIGALSRAVRFGPAIYADHEGVSANVDFVKVLGELYLDHNASSILKYYVIAWKQRLASRFKLGQSTSNKSFLDQLLEKNIIDQTQLKQLKANIELLTEAEDGKRINIKPMVTNLEQVWINQN